MLPSSARIEIAIEHALGRLISPGTPPGLAAAIRHAVIPGGSRLRPQLCLLVAEACGAEDSRAAEASAVALEFLHCASLVHDDLPCFDDAALRRGQPSTPREFGEPLAVLAGDALIVFAFQHVARACPAAAVPGLIETLSDGVGAVRGIIAGQAWESEPNADLGHYHRTKAGGLFAAATRAGALAASVDADAWHEFGVKFGEAYQVADDLLDTSATPTAIGKPVWQDATHGRPNASLRLGTAGARERFDLLVAQTIAAIPNCHGREELIAWVTRQTDRLRPSSSSMTSVSSTSSVTNST